MEEIGEYNRIKIEIELLLRGVNDMRIFEEAAGLSELEQAERWEEAVDFLYQRWQNDRNDVQKLCMLLFECWSVLIDPRSDDRSEQRLYMFCQKRLTEVTEYGMEKFDSDPLFLWMAGYCISLFPFLFHREEKSGEEEKWDKKGEELLLRATKIAPDNLIARVFYYGCFSDRTEYMWAKIQLAPMLGELFPGTSAIDRYFREILSLKE